MNLRTPRFTPGPVPPSVHSTAPRRGAAQRSRRISPRRHQAAIALAALAFSPHAAHATLRVVSYNIDSADQGNDNNITAPYAGLPTAIEGIGLHHIGTTAQPADVIGLEELNSSTLSHLVTALNSYYGAGTYAFVNINDPSTGGGTDGLIYNTKTVQVINSTVIGTASGSGAPRAPLRYQIRPLGYGADADFYMYVSHYKAGSATADPNNPIRRNAEAQEIRANADALGPSAHILFTGDYNLSAGSSEASYQTLVAAGGAGRAYDPVAASTNYVSNWANSSSTWKYLYSQSSTSLGSRIDLQLVSNAVLTQPGFQLAPDTSDPFTGNFPSSKYHYAYEVFGNNGTTPLNGAVTNAANTSLNDLPNPSTYLNALKNFDSSGNFVGSDHLPVVADYNLVDVNPVWLAWTGGAGNWSAATRWLAGVVPNLATTEARIDNSLTSTSSTVTLDQDATVKDLVINSGDALLISPGKTLTLAGPTSSVLSGTLTNAGGTLAASAPIVNAGNFTQSVTGTLSASSFTNTGTVSLSGAQQWAPNATFTNNGGTATFNSDAGTPASSPLAVNASAGTVIFNSSQHLLTLSLSNNAQATLPSTTGTPTTLTLKNLSLSGPATTLDLADNTLSLTYSIGSPIDQIRGYLRSGALFSSTAAADPRHLLALAYSDTGSAVTTQLATLGDANLDGTVNADDYALLDRSLAQHLPLAHWTDGDFNYDGAVNQQDYLLIDTTYLQQQGGTPSPAFLAQRQAEFGDAYVHELVAAVPEPSSSLLLLATGYRLLTTPRSRRRK